jgi:hypothetical protein
MDWRGTGSLCAGVGLSYYGLAWDWVIMRMGRPGVIMNWGGLVGLGYYGLEWDLII